MTVNIRGKEYVEVKERIREFYGKYPKGLIETVLVWHPEGNMSQVLFKAIAKSDTGLTMGMGHAYEEQTSGGNAQDVNDSSWVENCETSAIGRALANMDIGVRMSDGSTVRPSAEEMKRVDRARASSVTPQESGLKIVPKVVRPVPTQTTGASSYLGKAVNLRAKIKDLFGHDKFFLQLLSNQGFGISNPIDIERSTDQIDFIKQLESFIEFIEGYLVGIKPSWKSGDGLRDLTPEQRESVLARAEKLTLI